MPTNVPNDGWVDDWLSPERFGTYLTASGGSRRRALDLYEWNAHLGAAFLHDLGHLEVGLRNAYDRQLAAAVVVGDTHWSDPATLLTLFPISYRKQRGQRVDTNATSRRKVEEARTRAGMVQGQRSPAPGKVLAETTFGFWTYLTSDFHEKAIWVPYLHKAFPPGTDRKHLNRTLIRVRDFRNRVAHHEPILSGSEGRRREISFVVKALSPAANRHLTVQSEVAAILAKRP
ncbi:hypothetical protein ACFUOZ_15315 [Paenarthrobacter sp. NPDC057355]|uniref:hypothetical protein n=1 Tax=Paenarthrobacter sp. NPDC057355 TaxID=3346105 RepID=UPI00363DA10D